LSGGPRRGDAAAPQAPPAGRVCRKSGETRPRAANSAGIQCRLPRLRAGRGRAFAGCDLPAKMWIMRLFRPLASMFLALLCAAFAAAGAHAREVSLQEAVAQAQRETDGKVLSVQTLNVGKRKFYRIKVLTRDGQVRIVQIPAEQ
jgi:hypothetical protein